MKTIRRGSKGSEVTLLQKMLNIQADGIFGPLTEEAVRDFQQKSRLVVDGIVGPKTWGALGAGGSSSRAVDEIIVHYSATPAGENFTVDQIRQKMHLPELVDREVLSSGRGGVVHDDLVDSAR